jgi:hypothetical protein
MDKYGKNFGKLIDKITFKGNKIILLDEETHEEENHVSINKAKQSNGSDDGIVEIQDDNDDADSHDPTEKKNEVNEEVNEN